jgi:hypothetical protein
MAHQFTRQFFHAHAATNAGRTLLAPTGMEYNRLRSPTVRNESRTTNEWLLAQALTILTGEEGGKVRCYLTVTCLIN